MNSSTIVAGTGFVLPLWQIKIFTPRLQVKCHKYSFWIPILATEAFCQKVPISLKFGPLSLLFLGSVQMKSPKGIQYMKSQIWKMVLKNSGKVPNHPQALQYRIWDLGINSKNPYKGKNEALQLQNGQWIYHI